MKRFAPACEILRREWTAHRLTPGRLVYLFRTTFGHGLRTAFFRDVVRPRILSTAPVRGDLDRTCEIHVLTSAGDWLNLLWVLKSFASVSHRRYPLCIHDDGTLDGFATDALKAAFPEARLVSRARADARVESLLAAFPRCRALRAANPLALKVFDFAAFLEADRMMILDSDILFFSAPTALLATLETSLRNSLNKDWRCGYTLDPGVIARLEFDLPPLINSGLGLIHRESMRLDWIEAFLTLPGILSHPHQIEQTLIALCSAKFGFSMLPPEYDVHTGPMRGGVPCRHYTGPIRHLMYGEGMRTLVGRGFLQSPWTGAACAPPSSR